MIEHLTLLEGTPSPLGLSFQKGSANFALFSKHATSVFLGLFVGNNPHPEREVPLKRTGIFGT